MSLAFKTDKLTLSNRLELQHRQRDTAEKNIEEEINQLKVAIGKLNRTCLDFETRELLNRLSRQLDVLRQSSERVSSSAEVYGAVQQEARISRAIEVMLLHVDNLKRIYDREHSELEDAKRYIVSTFVGILADHNLGVDDHHRLRLLSPPESSQSVPTTPRITNNASRVRSVSVINNSGSANVIGDSSSSSTVSFF